MLICKLEIYSLGSDGNIQIVEMNENMNWNNKPYYEYKYVGLVWGRIIIEDRSKIRIEIPQHINAFDRVISYLHPDFIICSKRRCELCENKFKCWTDNFIYESHEKMIEELAKVAK